MNVRLDFPVVLRIEAAELARPCREALLALLVDYSVAVIHENDAEPGIAWDVSFGERALPMLDDPGFESPELSARLAFKSGTVAPLDVNWRRYPDLLPLITAEAGRAVAAAFGALGVQCGLLAETGHWSITEFEESHGRVQVKRIIVSPPWQFPDPVDGTIILTIRPSTGFGTGHHPSTRLVLSLLQQVQCAGRDVLDVGTGSGVLAMAAARLGAARVCAIDRDPDALAAAAEGLRRNRLTDRVELRRADISTEAVGQDHLVIANLEAVQIQAWADSLLRHVRRPGQLLVSGFLAVETDLVSRALRQPVRLAEREDGWAAAVFDCPAC